MIREKEEKKYLEIDLTGPEGNAFVLLGTANRLCRQLEYDASEVHKRMTESDYENLVNVFDEYFGDYVILYR